MTFIIQQAFNKEWGIIKLLKAKKFLVKILLASSVVESLILFDIPCTFKKYRCYLGIVVIISVFFDGL